LKNGRHWLYNATVGAGLPVNHTVRDLIESGDSILALSGIFSGTLSWLFLQFDGTVPFTDLVDQAWQQGLTEPDPRVDLSGKDVMRKLVILAREAGYDIEPDQCAWNRWCLPAVKKVLSITSLKMAKS
jgi:aspartokinase/homoserine dehydrogenase 2